MSRWDEYETTLLALVLWREARGEPFQAKLAVAYSIMNRVTHPAWWGTTLSEVIAKKWQYSSMTAPSDPNLVKWPLRGDRWFMECLHAAELAQENPQANPVPGADSYHDTSIPSPNWADPQRLVGQIGHLVFYNLDHDMEAQS